MVEEREKGRRERIGRGGRLEEKKGTGSGNEWGLTVRDGREGRKEGDGVKETE